MDHQPPQPLLPQSSKQKRQQILLEKKAETIQQTIQSSSPSSLQAAEDSIEKLLKSIKSPLDSQEIWIYITIDSFPTSIEERDDPSLLQIPYAISNSIQITSLSRLALLTNLSPQMGINQARNRCKDLLILRENLEKYKTESLKFKGVIKTYDSQFEEQGLDKAAICVTQVLKRRCMDTDAGRAALAQEIRKKISLEMMVSCSAGVASNKVLARICSQINAPNGQFYLRPENIRTFMNTLEVERHPMISKNEAKLLGMIGIETCGDVLQKKAEIFLGFSEKLAKRYLKAALGAGENLHCQARVSKNSFSAGKKFEPNNCEEFLEEKLKELSFEIEFELKRNKVKGKGIGVTIKNFQYESRSRKEEAKGFYRDGKELFELAVTLLRMFYPIEPVRTLVLKVWNFKQNAEKVCLTGNKNKKIDKGSLEFMDMFVNKSILPGNGNIYERAKVLNEECKICKEILIETNCSLYLDTKNCKHKNNK